MRTFALVASAVTLVACSSSSGDAAPTPDATTDADEAIVETSGGDVPFADTTRDVPLDEETSSARKLDCAWATDTKNCWRTFVRHVDDCLGVVAGSGITGTMSADGTSCTYATGRAAAFAIPFEAGASSADRDFTATNGASICLHYVEHASATGFTVTGVGGTLVYTAAGNDVTVTCPDGTTYEGNAENIALGCGEAIIDGGTPGNQIEDAPIRFKLSGARDWELECLAADADAGADVDAAGD